MGKREFIKRMWADSAARAAIIVAVLFAVGSFLNVVVKGLESVSDFFLWAQWLYVRLNTPWIGLFILILVGSLLWIGIRRVEESVRNGEDDRLVKDLEKLEIERTQFERIEEKLMQVDLLLTKLWLDRVFLLQRTSLDRYRTQLDILRGCYIDDPDIEMAYSNLKSSIHTVVPDPLALDGFATLPAHNIERLPPLSREEVKTYDRTALARHRDNIASAAQMFLDELRKMHEEVKKEVADMETLAVINGKRVKQWMSDRAIQ